MNITFSCDKNYAPYLTTLIYRIISLRGDKEYEINFYILDLGMDLISKEYISKVFYQDRVSIYFISVNLDDFLGFPQTINYISKATYARLKVSDYLPENLEKTIYLDIDIIVNQDLYSLWNIDIGNNIIGACLDPYIENFKIGYKKEIGISNRHYYFNAGVMIFNLNKCRRIDLFSKCIYWVNDNKNFIYQDQDILNGVCENDIFYLDSKYNFTSNHRSRIKEKVKGRIIKLNQLEILTPPIIIYHHVGNIKPWDLKSIGGYSELFYSTYKLLINPPTHWVIDKPNLVCRVKRIIRTLKDKYFYNIY